MKFILPLLFFATFSVSQNCVVRFGYVSPGPSSADVCPNQPVKICFTWDTTAAGSYPGYNKFEVNCINQYSTVWNNNYHAFYSLPKEVIGTRVFSCLTFSSPVFIQKGPAFVISDGDMVYYNYILCDATTGIEELTAEKKQRSYFDIYGNKVGPEPNRLLLEKIGNSFRKVIIQ